MRTYHIHLRLSGSDSGIERYCPGCGRVVIFHDSGKIRRNANGKTIHGFAIYKCPRDHTWNRRLDAMPAGPAKSASIPGAQAEEKARLEDIWDRGFSRVDLHLEITGGGLRLDKALSEAFTGLSRSDAQRLISGGRVLLAGCSTAKQGLILRHTVNLSVLPKEPSPG